jgi:hypothetical protein
MFPTSGSEAAVSWAAPRWSVISRIAMTHAVKVIRFRLDDAVELKPTSSFLTSDTVMNPRRSEKRASAREIVESTTLDANYIF